MKSYKTLLQQLALHNTSQMKQLKQSKSSFDKLITILNEADNKICMNTKKIKSTLNFVQQITIRLLQDLNQQLSNYFQRKKTQSPNLIICGCQFETQSPEEYVQHLECFHQSFKYVKGSTHFVTFFGNVIRCDDFILRHFSLTKTKEKRCLSLTRKQKDCLKTKHKKKNQQNQNQKMNSSLDLHKIESNIKDSKTNVQIKKQEILNSIKDSKYQNTFKCGQCQKQFDRFRMYSFHMRSHDYIIHPDSSHIIIRKRKGQPFVYLNVNQKTNFNEKFNCPCNPNIHFTRDQFIAHAFKWHKGLVPK